jgi:hypothetical protein|tara:strand:- start:368 stop:757 length:390 start_codon:yes stop_codon:yes gene_type:complete
VDVAAEVVEQMLGRAERLFGVDVPTFFSQSFEQQVKIGSISQGRGLAWEDEILLIESLLEKVEELALEDHTECFYGEEEIFAGGDPTSLIERQSSLGDEAVEVVLELLVPGMKDQDKAWSSPKMSASEG